jgi:hypothetical protein
MAQHRDSARETVPTAYQNLARPRRTVMARVSMRWAKRAGVTSESLPLRIAGALSTRR